MAGMRRAGQGSLMDRIVKGGRAGESSLAGTSKCLLISIYSTPGVKESWGYCFFVFVFLSIIIGGSWYNMPAVLQSSKQVMREKNIRV